MTSSHLDWELRKQVKLMDVPLGPVSIYKTVLMRPHGNRV